MPAGQLRESVTFQRLGSGAGSTLRNQLTDFANIADLISLPAQIKPLRQGEVVLAEGVQGRVLFEVTLRHTAATAGIRVGDRMVDARSGATFNVKSPPTNPDMRTKYTKVMVEQGGADG
jgi:hypothetical protein